MQDINNKWRFPGNNFTSDNGLDTADMETFKKDAISSLAREICQNSLDAHRKEALGPVKVVFNSFVIDRNDIPNVDEIENQIDKCLETWDSHKLIKSQLTEMKNQIRKSRITCLRISDYNTTGLVGVSGDEKSPWRYLVHGSGISDKSSTSGGSKGIGKFATFVTSHFNTVFYSTVTEKNEQGYEGICKLCSANMEGTKEKTLGIGYFGSSDKNEPIINSQLVLDKAYTRDANNYGSDVYIIGFKEPQGWKRDIITKTLDSFMSAIVFGSLVVQVDDVDINIDTLKDIVYSDDYINPKYKKSIVSQYLLLTDEENRYEEIITVEGYGEAKFYLYEFDSSNDSMATNSCVMIRYPYMKIKELTKITTIPCSAMCIIENNKLNEILRIVENPQHTDWEFNRIDDMSKRTEVKAIYSDLCNQIRNIIAEHLANSDRSETDLAGAENVLESVERADTNNNNNNGEKKPKDKPTIKTRKVKRTPANINASVEEQGGDGVTLDLGEYNDNPGDDPTPDSHNKGGGGSINPGHDKKEGKTNDDGKPILKHAELRQMNYRFMCLNKYGREYGITFISDYDEKECSLELYLIDDSGIKYPVMIEIAKINGYNAEVKDGKISNFEIKHGERYNILLQIDQEEMFSCEVRVYAYR